MPIKDSGIYMELEQLGNYARNSASSDTIKGKCDLSGKIKEVRARLSSLRKIAQSNGEYNEGLQWIYDNYYLAQREGRAACMRLRDSGKLPAVAPDRTRVMEAAMSLVYSGLGQVTPERVELFLREYQRVSVLTEEELNLFLPSVTLQLIVYLAELAEEQSDKDDLQKIFKNVFTSLRLISSYDFTLILDSASKVEEALLRDPAGIYPHMDRPTRQYYRKTVARLAKRYNMTQVQVVTEALKMAEKLPDKHVGTYLIKNPLGKKKRKPTGQWYIGLNIFLTLFFTVLFGICFSSPFIVVLLIIPISEIVKNLVDYISVSIVHPSRLPRIELKDGVPKVAKTICVISALLASEKDGEKYAGALEEYMLLNRKSGENLFFGILADLPEHTAAEKDTDKAYIAAAVKSIERLNSQYGNRFCLLLRKRELNRYDGVYMGYERKRGAVSELVKLLLGRESKVIPYGIDRETLAGTAYIVTLDSDTRVTAGSILELIGTAMHPLNKPVIDRKRGAVVSGYGIIQPKMATDLKSGDRSDFTRIFAGHAGIDPYNSTASEVYQDLFAQGSFSGKGLINVPVYGALMIDAFPENIVLSHDLLEGGYMGCGYASDIEFTDSFPYKVTSYFSRMNRWTRGDWQNIRYVKGHVRNGKGERVENPLNELSRWKVFDNLRRSLVPVMIFLSLFIGALVGTKAFAVSAFVAVLAHGTGLVISSTRMLLRHDGTSKLRYHSGVIPGMAGVIMTTFVRLILLPAEAWTNLSAIVSSVYRMTVSHKKLLQWVTASETEKRYGNTMRVNYIKLAVCPIAGILAIILPVNAGLSALGLVWIFAPAYSWALSREYSEEKNIYSGERNFLSQCAAQIWGFFDESLQQQDNYLPVDNIQTQPPLGKAHRTSPTNIGLSLLACLSAHDLGLITKEDCVTRIENTISTVEKLEKWNGHLYNWYDTETLKPLKPAYVSTVDSGNFAACLVVLKETFKQWNFTELSHRCDALFESMSFKPLYDRKRRLFYIGWDMGKDAPTDGWYDLLSSEARTTSYMAVARGDVPVKHWKTLGRALVSLDNYSGMVSWTGTMFEYLMPNLFLPCLKNSLIYESSKFCVYAQRKNGGKQVWGISESGFYAFNPGMSYSYKAHGVQTLALKRNMEQDRVIAPYASFLALSVEPTAAIKNLKVLKNLGATGKWGFYEAVDFTPSRQIEGSYEIVYAYMAHHLGMSIVAIDNLLCGNIMQKRFMSDVRMKAYFELLEEKVPMGQVILKLPETDVPKKPEKLMESLYRSEGEVTNPYQPACIPLSNGAYSIVAAENGKTLSSWHGRLVTRWDSIPLGKNGTELFFTVRGHVYSLLPAPLYDKSVKYGFSFSGEEAVYTAECQEFSSEVRVRVPGEFAGELWSVNINSQSGGELIYCFEPVMDGAADYNAHPAFSRLCLEACKGERHVTFRRRSRGEKKEVYLTLTCDRPGEICTAPERGVFPGCAEFKKLCPEMSCSYTIKLSQGEEKLVFSKSVSYSKKNTEEDGERILKRREKPGVSHLEAASVMLGLKSIDMALAVDYITPLLFKRNRENTRAYPRKALWKFGISGDNPILSARVDSDEKLTAALSLIRRHAFLSENGVKSDLALIITDGGDYRSRQSRAAEELLTKIGRRDSIGQPGGVHLVDAQKDGAETVLLLSDLTIDLDRERLAERTEKEPFPYVPEIYQKKHDGRLGCTYGENCEYRLALKSALPPLNWSNVLSNGSFGCIVTETGSGYMWLQNAHERRINRWINDPMTLWGSERIYLRRRDRKISLFACGDDNPTLVTYGLGYQMWEKEIDGTKIKMTCFVPEGETARVLIIRSQRLLDGDRLEFFSDVILGERGEGAVSASMDNGRLVFASGDSGMRACLAFSEEINEFTTDGDSGLKGDFDGKLMTGKNICAAVTLDFTDKIVMVWSDSTDTASKLSVYENAERELLETEKRWKERACPVTVKTGYSRLDRYINGWALYQVIACRILGRSSMYQSGGAMGFRDQLQDSMALIQSRPEKTAEQIRLCCRHQYTEGDVQHWWHQLPKGSRGVRTRISDDLLWLPYVLWEYVDKTGDYGICRVKESYLVSAPLGDGERDRYEAPQTSQFTESVLNHAGRAAELFMKRGVGNHGLALIGDGDWNDGFNSVGDEGKGESVWLSFFGAISLTRLSELYRKDGDKEKADKISDYATGLKKAAEKAWDGEWFLRGYYDDGKPLGSHENSECSIDSIAQSFAAFALGKGDMVNRALLSACENLYSPETRLVKLFTPPFGDGSEEPGYVKSYGQGFRENGGQYTHGAIWLAGALFETGEAEKGWQIINSILPGERDMEIYKGEDFVIAADVYSGEDNLGRCGWSWYTGAAGWMYRTVTEELLGIVERQGRLYIEPKLPESWEGYVADIGLGGEKLHVEVKKTEGRTDINVNGKVYSPEGYGIKTFKSLGER